MKIYKIYACAYGTFWEYDVNCPPGWYGSGCYDVEVECIQEASFDIAANGLEKAVELTGKMFEEYQGSDWSYDVHAVYYDPDAVEVKDDPDDGETEEVFDFEYQIPENGSDVPEEYSKEI